MGKDVPAEGLSRRRQSAMIEECLYLDCIVFGRSIYVTPKWVNLGILYRNLSFILQKSDLEIGQPLSVTKESRVICIP